MPTLTVWGDPVPKGSMHCIGKRGRVNHVLIDNQADELRKWQPKITRAGEDALARRQGVPLPDGPIDVALTVTVARPATISYAERPWPTKRSAGDIDKLQRAVYDALQNSGLIKDDALIVHCDVWHCYPDTVDCPGRLDRPGIVIRVDPLYQPTPDLFGVDQ